MLVIEGDPGYIIGANPDGTPNLLPVQGSSKRPPSKGHCQLVEGFEV
jgi:hypothetical protein